MALPGKDVTGWLDGTRIYDCFVTFYGKRAGGPVASSGMSPETTSRYSSMPSIQRERRLRHAWRELENPLDLLVARVSLGLGALVLTAAICLLFKGIDHKRQNEHELGASAVRVIEGEAAAVGESEFTGDVEAETVAAGGLAD